MKTVLCCVWLVLLGYAPSIQAVTCPSTTVGQTYPFTARLPSGCQQSACTFFLGATKNANDPNYLDFRMEGTAIGYIAVGFSAGGSMSNSDVIMCGVDATAAGGVGIVDAYNKVGRTSVRDTTQNVCPYSASFTNGRIVCSFSKLINTGDTTQDVVLNGSYYLLQVATSSAPAGSGTTLAPAYHATTPPISSVAVNIVSYLSSGGSNSTTTAPPVSTTTAPPVATTTTPPVGSCPSTVSSNSYRFKATIPDSCEQSSCSFFLGVNTNTNNPQYLDFRMEGTAIGYIAVGFSAGGSMSNSDVIMCGVDATAAGGVGIVDAYNQAGRTSVRDTTQNVCPYSASFTNGRIVCSFSKLINTGDTTQDVVLNGSYYLLQVATSSAPAGSGTTLAPAYHATTPPISSVAVNIVSYLFSGGSNSTTTPPPVGSCPSFVSSNSYRFKATIPDSCEQSSCSFFLGVSTNTNNPQYLDFWMEGNANGYIAVGFSPDGKMPNSDVIMCGVDSTLFSGVGFVDAYNPGYSSVRDSTQNLCPVSSNFINGRIKCSFSRLINTGDTGQDKVLNSSYYLLMATVNNAPIGSGSTLAPSYHLGQRPLSSDQSLNPAQFSGQSQISAFPKTPLTKVHGILMLISWPLLAVTGIFFAAWMKPALGPPPMPPKWFTIHRVLMLASMFIGAAGFLLVFVANKGLISLDPSRNLAHFLIGIFVMLLHIINPIISAFRCLPTSPRRWIFNLLHGSLIGLAVEMLALVNCGIGLSLFESNGYSSSPGSYRSLGFYVTYVVLLFLLFIALFSIFTGIAVITGGEKGLKLGPAVIKPILEYFIGETKPPAEPVLFRNAVSETIPGTATDATVKAQEPKPATPPPSATPVTKQPKSKDVVLRWIGLTVFLCITIPLILIVIVLVAV